MTSKDGERLVSLDALRGLAVLGILAVNASLFAVPMYQAWFPSHWPFPVSPMSTWLFAVVQVLFTGKFITLFSMLFGVSTYLVGGELADRNRSRVLYRRLAWLSLFGLLHGLLIWWGDILLIYAICGLLIAPLRSWPAGRLVALGGVGYAVLAVGAGALSVSDPDYSVETWNLVLVHEAGYRGGFLDSLRANIGDWLAINRNSATLNVLGSALLMLLGLGLYKCGVLQAKAKPRVYWTMIAAGLAGLAIMGAITVHEIRAHFDIVAMTWSEALKHLTAPLITGGYVGAVMLAVQRRAAIAEILAPVGRMAFSNYLTQSVVMTAIFYGGRGLGLFGKVDRPGLAAIVVAIWIAQILVSHLWLKRYRMGPAEWLWRSLTYGRPVPIRRTPA